MDKTVPPQLLEPTDGSLVASLAPLLTWIAPQAGKYEQEAAFDAAFTTLAFTTTLNVVAPLTTQTFVLDGNLISRTVYWRIGEKTADGLAFSQVRSFTTPAKNAALLPAAPNQITPANQAQLTTPDALLEWQAVPNSLYYRVNVYRPDGVYQTGATVAASTTLYGASGLKPHTTYTWKVKALNSKGWSIYSAKWTFTTP